MHNRSILLYFTDILHYVFIDPDIYISRIKSNSGEYLYIYLLNSLKSSWQKHAAVNATVVNSTPIRRN